MHYLSSPRFFLFINILFLILFEWGNSRWTQIVRFALMCHEQFFIAVFHQINILLHGGCTSMVVRNGNVVIVRQISDDEITRNCFLLRKKKLSCNVFFIFQDKNTCLNFSFRTRFVKITMACILLFIL